MTPDENGITPDFDAPEPVAAPREFIREGWDEYRRESAIEKYVARFGLEVLRDIYYAGAISIFQILERAHSTDVTLKDEYAIYDALRAEYDRFLASMDPKKS